MWSLLLTRVRQLGIEAVYTPVPWGFHEFAANKFDFNGVTNPRRNIRHFIDLAAAMGFHIRLDLSPAVADELAILNHGLPGWLSENYSQVQDENRQGEALSKVTLTHPTVLKLIERWFDQLSHALLERQQNPNQTITAQIDPTLMIGADLARNIHVAEVQWPVWLRKRYVEGGIEALNQAYQPTIPYQSFSKVPLDAALESPLFQQDRQAFLSSVTQETQQTYTALLEARGWSLAEPIELPVHSFQVKPDPLDIGESFQWAVDAPLRPDGSPRPNFWLIKQANFTSLSDVIYRRPGADRVMPLDRTETVCYRLLLSGQMIERPLDLRDGRPMMTYVAYDELGETDLYFALADANVPLSDFLSRYLNSLLAAQRQSLLHIRGLADQLTAAMNPVLVTPTTRSTPSTTLQAAEQGLDEAMLALQKATTSIGALEQAFAVALDKPELVMTRPLLGIDGAQIQPVQTAIQAVANYLAAAVPADFALPSTVNQDQTAYNQMTAAAEQAIDLLEPALRWLRQGLADQSLSPATRLTHAHLETILQLLVNGVLRQD
jgi:hypothetical protein